VTLSATSAAIGDRTSARGRFASCARRRPNGCFFSRIRTFNTRSRRISEVRIEDLYDLDDVTLIATAVFVLEVGFSLTFSREDFRRSARVVEILGGDQENEPFSTVTIGRDNEFEVRLRLNLDHDTKHVKSFDIDDVRARWIY
jgi:hypothetical protein